MIDLRSTLTYMINLDKDQHEFPDAARRFSKLGIQVERLSAVYGKSLSKEYIDSVVHPYGLHTIKNEMLTLWDILSLGAVGCSLSHIKAWKMLLDSDQELLHVLEDDADPKESVEEMNQFVNEVEKIDPEWDVIYLGYLPKFLGSCDQKLESGIWRIRSMMPGTQSYLISKRGAKKLMEHAFPLVNAIDAYMSLSFMNRDVRAYRRKSFISQSRPVMPLFSNVQTKMSVRPMIAMIPQGVTGMCYLVTIGVLVYLVYHLVKKKR